MKTIEIIRFTGEMEEKTVTVKDEAGVDVKQVQEIHSKNLSVPL